MTWPVSLHLFCSIFGLSRSQSKWVAEIVGGMGYILHAYLLMTMTVRLYELPQHTIHLKFKGI